jgi:hypothetical protein
LTNDLIAALNKATRLRIIPSTRRLSRFWTPDFLHVGCGCGCHVVLSCDALRPAECKHPNNDRFILSKAMRRAVIQPAEAGIITVQQLLSLWRIDSDEAIDAAPEVVDAATGC